MQPTTGSDNAGLQHVREFLSNTFYLRYVRSLVFDGRISNDKLDRNL